MTNITRDEIMDRKRRQRLADHYNLFNPSDPSVVFLVLAVDVGGRGGYAESAVGKQLVRFDVSGSVRTPHGGLRVRITVMEDTGDIAGTLSPTGESWPGHQVPVWALDKGAEAARTPAELLEFVDKLAATAWSNGVPDTVSAKLHALVIALPENPMGQDFAQSLQGDPELEPMSTLFEPRPLNDQLLVQLPLRRLDSLTL